MTKKYWLAISLFTIGLLNGFGTYGQKNVREIKISKDQRYLNFPVTSSAELKKIRIMQNGKVIDEVTIKLSDGKPDFWTFFDVSSYQGKTITLDVEGANTAAGLDRIFPDTVFPGQDSVYHETLRPQVHFSSRRGWLNDPNGLIYHMGEYHLYYQHNAFGWEWGNMHWGHAVSKDLLHWDELPDALLTPDHDDMAFSGSAVIDASNTAGFRRNGIDPLIAIYTSTGRGECLALSYDNGRTFEQFKGNPVIRHKGRDPKVFWYAPANHWVLVLYDESETKEIGAGQKVMVRQHAIYTSPDLKQWTYQSSNHGFFECAELFEIAVEGEKDLKKWVMYGADGKYLVGTFDGKKFTGEQTFRNYDYGTAFYASQMYNNMPSGDGRHIQLGWARGTDAKGMPFNQCMAFPTSLTLRKNADGYRLCPRPIAAIKTLFKTEKTFDDIVLAGDKSFQAPIQGDVMHIVAEFEFGDSREFGLNINGYQLTYNGFFKELNDTPLLYREGERLKIEVIVDRIIIEVFVNDGELYYVASLNSASGKKIIEAFARGGGDEKTILKKLTIHELNSVWNKK